MKKTDEKIIETKKKRVKRKHVAFKKTKLGEVFNKIFFFFKDEKENYSFSELFVTTLVSLVLGFFVCFSLFTLLSGGRNYFKISKQLDKFYDVYDVLMENYNGEVDGNKLIEAAINGMVLSVGDAYTNYGDSKAADDFNELVSGVYEGIGCTIKQEEDTIVIVDVYADSPAEKAGLKAGDIVKSVDDIDAKKSDINKLSNYIKNEAKGKVTIVVIRDKEEKTFILERAKVEVPSVTSKVFEVNSKKVGYLRIAIFSSVSASQFKSELKKLEKDGIDSLVIDVRDNNGGYLTAVTEIVNSLLPKGKIIYQMQRNGKKKVTKDNTVECREYPIAVIANGNSASASEILAAAIKESYGGYVVGVNTYGKGTVQQVKILSDGSMVKYTVENWLTPDGNWINEKGIKPTNEVIMAEEYYKDPKDDKDNQLQEALNLVSK